MKASHILFALTASITTIASPLPDDELNEYGAAKTNPNDQHLAPDPPPAP